MKNLITQLMEAAHRFTATDFAFFKVCLLSGGILLGSYFACFFHSYIGLIWFLFGSCFLFLWIQIVRYLKKK